jgi:hypothetical protein
MNLTPKYLQGFDDKYGNDFSVGFQCDGKIDTIQGVPGMENAIIGSKQWIMLA